MAARERTATELELLLSERDHELDLSRTQAIQQQARLRALALEAQQAREAERRRIALELHDTVARQIAGALFVLEGRRSDASSVAVRQACLTLRRAHTDIHRTIFALRPPALGATGLAGALRGLLGAYRDQFNAVVKVSCRDAARRLTSEADTAVYRAVQEGVHNIVAHSDARRVTLALAFRPDGLYVTLHDDGKGFDAGRIDIRPAEHLGILGMRQRLEDIGGRLTVESNPGAGCTLTFFAPAAPEASDAAATVTAFG